MQHAELEGLYEKRFGRVRFESLAEVAQWVEINGGELSLRNALADNVVRHEGSRIVAQAWITEQERLRSEDRDNASLELASRSAVAAETAARYAMWSAIISTVSTIVALAAYLLSRP